MIDDVSLHIITEMPFSLKWKWGIGSGIIIILILWHILHNRFTWRLEDLQHKDIAMLKRVAVLRSAGIVLLSITCLVLIFYQDTHNFLLERAIEKKEQEAAILAAKQEAALRGVPHQDNLPVISDTMIKEALAVYADDKMDEIKARYEDIFVSYFYLFNCKKINDSGYPKITQALQYELKYYNVTTDPTQQIFSAAQGSYDLLYKDSSCDDETIKPVLDGYNSLIDSLSKASVSQAQPAK